MVTPSAATSKRQRTRERILGCALDLFERHGFDHTTIAQIAAMAGVTEMTCFRHFRRKTSLFSTTPTTR